jgi:hypothetical protein
MWYAGKRNTFIGPQISIKELEVVATVRAEERKISIVSEAWLIASLEDVAESFSKRTALPPRLAVPASKVFLLGLWLNMEGRLATVTEELFWGYDYSIQIKSSPLFWTVFRYSTKIRRI